jgi:hypothetical protein
MQALHIPDRLTVSRQDAAQATGLPLRFIDNYIEAGILQSAREGASCWVGRLTKTVERQTYAGWHAQTSA